MVEQAALWHARLGDGDAVEDAAELRAFDAWRALDPLHAVAFERIAGIDERLRPQGRIEQAALKGMWRSRRRATTLLGALLLIGVGAWLTLPRAAPTIDHRTAPGEQLQVALADGSRLVVGTDSALNTRFLENERDVQLLRGEIHATVAKGLRAPFVVHTSDGSARALGTAYTVRKNPHDTVVDVIESHVEVCSVAPHRCLELAPGQRARLDAGGVARLPDRPVDDMAAWTRGWLPVEEAALPDVLRELNRYRRTPIGYDAAVLASLKVSGYLPLRDTDRALAIIARSLPLTIDRSDAARPQVTIRPRAEEKF